MTKGESGMSDLSWICLTCGQAHYDRKTGSCIACLTPRQKTLRQLTTEKK